MQFIALYCRCRSLVELAHSLPPLVIQNQLTPLWKLAPQIQGRSCFKGRWCLWISNENTSDCPWDLSTKMLCAHKHKGLKGFPVLRLPYRSCLGLLHSQMYTLTDIVFLLCLSHPFPSHMHTHRHTGQLLKWPTRLQLQFVSGILVPICRINNVTFYFFTQTSLFSADICDTLPSSLVTCLFLFTQSQNCTEDILSPNNF